MRSLSAKGYIAALRVHLIPVIVWVTTVVCVAILFSHRAKRYEVLAIAQSQLHPIAATCTGRLMDLSVELFDEVKAGQILAVLDIVTDDQKNPQLLQAQLNTIAAEIERLRAQLAATEDQLITEAANLQNDRIADERRFAVDVENARLRVLELKTAIETDKISLQRLQLNSKIFLLQGRLDANDAAYYQLQKIKLERDTLAKRIEENQRLLAQAQQDLQTAIARRDKFVQKQPQTPSVEKALAVIRKAIVVQERRMEELQVQHPHVELKSPVDGVVSLIQHSPGDTVLAGEPILTIAEKKATYLVAYASEQRAGSVKQNAVVQVIKRTQPQQIATSQVTQIGPTVEQLPQRLWRNPNVPQWGRPVIIKVPPQFRILPGEVVGVRGL